MFRVANMEKCSFCGQKKDNVSPKIVAKTTSQDPRLASKNDVLITKVICQDCYDFLKASDEFAKKCLNPNCNSILFISGRLDADADMRGIDRDLRFQNDSKGYFIECSKCGAKHNIEIRKGSEGAPGHWCISGLRL